MNIYEQQQGGFPLYWRGQSDTVPAAADNKAVCECKTIDEINAALIADYPAGTRGLIIATPLELARQSDTGMVVEPLRYSFFEYRYPHTRAQVEANKWQEITREESRRLLEVLYPARWDNVNGCFLVGELYCTTDTDDVYMCVAYAQGRHWKRPETLKDFNGLRYREEIMNQVLGR